MIKVADRLHTVEEYYFSKKLREVNLLKASGKPIINLGIGSPDLKPPQRVIDAITESMVNANAHKYQSYQGMPALRNAMAEFYVNHFNAHLFNCHSVFQLHFNFRSRIYLASTSLGPKFRKSINRSECL